MSPPLTPIDASCQLETLLTASCECPVSCYSCIGTAVLKCFGERWFTTEVFVRPPAATPGGHPGLPRRISDNTHGDKYILRGFGATVSTMTPTHADLLAAVERSPDAATRHDRAGWVVLFTPDGRVEDPVGSRPHIGHAEIGRFYATFIGPRQITFHRGHSDRCLVRAARPPRR